jgi:hemerythrin superfamily protein
MSAATEDRAKAAQYADGDVLSILYSQHATVHELVESVESTTGRERSRGFDELTALLAAHEAAEQNVIRPVTSERAEAEIADARTAEEQHADLVIARLKALDVDTTEFEDQFGDFKKAVSAHADAEESDEFPALAGTSDEERLALGSRFLAAFRANGGQP